jgi:hypothetical protein
MYWFSSARFLKEMQSKYEKKGMELILKYDLVFEELIDEYLL